MSGTGVGAPIRCSAITPSERAVRSVLGNSSGRATGAADSCSQPPGPSCRCRREDDNCPVPDEAVSGAVSCHCSRRWGGMRCAWCRCSCSLSSRLGRVGNRCRPKRPTVLFGSSTSHLTMFSTCGLVHRWAIRSSAGFRLAGAACVSSGIAGIGARSAITARRVGLTPPTSPPSRQRRVAISTNAFVGADQVIEINNG